MGVSFAITVCDEYDEFVRLFNHLKNSMSINDEIVVLYDTNKGDERIINFMSKNLSDNIIFYTSKFKKNFSEWKNLLNSLCTKNYILQIDADEMLTSEFIKSIHLLLNENPTIDLYYIPRVNTVHGIETHHLAMWNWNIDEKGRINYPDYQGRLYKKGLKWEGKVHEKITGHQFYATLPLNHQFLYLIHNKTIDKQIKQNILYDSLSMNLESIYNQKCVTPSDINEHLPTLKRYAEECEHITEMGVRWVVSTYAFMMGKPKKLISYDLDPTEKFGISSKWLKELGNYNNIDFNFIIGDTLQIEIEETDLLFIDTWHVYEQLKKELELHGNKSRKYIIFHDTTTFGINGETKGYEGLWPAIEEFIQNNPHWGIHERFTNNNGLTILKRK